MSAPATIHWTPEAIRDLGVRTNMATACSVLDISTSGGYSLLARNQFPVRTVRVGSRIVVPVSGLLELLGIDQHAAA